MDNLIVIGNLTNYHNASRLITASNGTTQASFTYDAKNCCVKRVINEVTNYLYYDDWNLIEERDNNGNLLASYVHGEKMDEILTRFTPTQAVYYHHDALGNVSHLTDDVGNLLEHYVYDAFGAPIILNATNGIITTSSYGNRFLFTGREYLPEMGLYDYRNRVYSTEFGRFLQVDPLKFKAKDINIYRYVGNNPVNWIDSHGLFRGPRPIPGKGLCKAWGYFSQLKKPGDGKFDNKGDDKLAHCLAHCEISKDLLSGGEPLSDVIGSCKEWADENIDNQTPDDGDKKANQDGQDCASDPRGCECCCKEKGY